jgi:predicted nucleotidyltransferase
MNASLLNISNKLPAASVEVLCDVTLHARTLDIPFFVLGATARDIIFGALYDIPTPRATMDIDLALRVENWEQYTQLRTSMLSTARYDPDTSHRQRLHHSNGAIIDLVPFGPLETPAGMIAWPPDQDIVMRTAGFEEALESAINVTVAVDPEYAVKVCTPAALAAMKLIAWYENYPARRKDAEDLLFIIREYVHAGNEARLYDADKDLFAAANYVSEEASPRLLGRDIRRIVTLETLRALVSILDAETADDSQFRLLSDMSRAGLREESSQEGILALLRLLRAGLTSAGTMRPAAS